MDDFDLPADSSIPFLVMRVIPSELVGEHALVLRVFGDGRCELERPPIMRGAGRHAWQLDAAEVRELARQALDAGLADLDARTLRAELRAAHLRNDDGGSIYRLDDDILEFDLRLDRLRGRSGTVQRDLHKQLRFVGLRGDRARHPNDERVKKLSELRDRLDAMKNGRAPLPELP